MARGYTTDAIFERVRLMGSIPDDPHTFEPEAMAKIADVLMQLKAVPTLMAANAKHFLDYVDYTTTSEVTYDIPKAAINRNLADVVYVKQDGSESPLTIIDYQTDIRERGGLRYPYGAAYIRGDQLILYPESQAGRTLRLYFHRLPGQLVLEEAAAQITAVDTGTGDVTTGGLPSTWTTANTFDFIQGDPGFRLRAEDVTASSVSSPTLTVPTAVAAELQVGDWVALHGESPIPQIPVEAHALLAQLVLVKVLEAMGDSKHKTSLAELAEMMAAYRTMTSPRVATAPPVLVSRNRLIDWIRTGG